ncbi:hypothetical protein GCM10011506_44860 [Marivirga lumbricoides]|uniref:DoxX family protein n=1 Tax=Marivirga lumbricoides TaxID=1046115 RepID=A0A2T4DSB2_9BACT|nr:DoxX family protein [Marivirga lumbricoides]GGC54269.1 hypothetical protein GCM10011506_44860 [Marivirga lumbricoides]
MKNANISLLIVRIAAGAMMLTHGYPKFLKLIAGDFAFADPIGMGQELSLILTVLAEFGCSILLILGLFTRWVAIPLAFTMLVAVFIVHGADPFSNKEFGLLYLALFLVAALSGPGKYSIDNYRRK